MDTKHIALKSNVLDTFYPLSKTVFEDPGTHLGNLYERVSAYTCHRETEMNDAIKHVPIVLPKGFQAYDMRLLKEGEKGRYHEAGYDAYCTGYLLIRLQEALEGSFVVLYLACPLMQACACA